MTRGTGPGRSRLLGPLAKKRQRACVRLSVDAYELGRSKANSELEPTIIPGDVITFLIAASKYEKTLKGRSLERWVGNVCLLLAALLAAHTTDDVPSPIIFS